LFNIHFINVELEVYKVESYKVLMRPESNLDILIDRFLYNNSTTPSLVVTRSTRLNHLLDDLNLTKEGMHFQIT